MRADELEAKIIAIKRRGLNILVEQEMIRELRATYFSEKINDRITAMSDQFRKNVNFLSRVLKDQATVGKISRYMGIVLKQDYEKVLFEKNNLYSLRFAVIVGEYYGLPVDLLLFSDLEANEQHFRQQYPTLLQQNRN